MAPIRNSSEDLILQKIDEINRKQDRIPELISEVERRQRADLDILRRDFERMFVSHAEYDPKHTIVLDRMKEYDQIVANSRATQNEYTTFKNMVNQHDEDIERMRTRSAGWPGRLLPWIAVFASIAAVLLNYAQHVVIR